MSDNEEVKVEGVEKVEVAKEEKPVVKTGVTGTVKWFNVKNGYGFVERSDTKEDIFVHQSAITAKNPNKYTRSLADGEEVLFDVVEGSKGLEAANVTGPNGSPVQGSTRRYFNRANGRRPRTKRADGETVTEGAEPALGADGAEDGEASGQRRRRGPRRNRRGPSKGGEKKEGGEAGEENAGSGEAKGERRRRPRGGRKGERSEGGAGDNNNATDGDSKPSDEKPVDKDISSAPEAELTA